MDWYSWLSRTNLEPTLVYEYGLTFSRNELQEEDLGYFNHEFLQSIGIHIAKHRLEIINLARKEAKGRPNGLSRLASAINETKKLFTKNIVKWGSFNKNPLHYPVSELSPYRPNLICGPRKINSLKEAHREKVGNVMRSGPLERRVQEKFMVASRSPSVSGPLNGKISYPNRSPIFTRPADGGARERMGFICRSPTVSRPTDKWCMSPKVSPYNQSSYSEKVGMDDGVQSLWYLMFQDMKPT